MAGQYIHKAGARWPAQHRGRVGLGEVRVEHVRVELRQHVPAGTPCSTVSRAQPWSAGAICAATPATPRGIGEAGKLPDKHRQS